MDDILEIQEQEEALSLCDLPTNTDVSAGDDDGLAKPKIDRRSSSEPTDFFEFFSDLSYEMSHAEDIIFCGKLVPFREQPHSGHTLKTTTAGDVKVSSFHRRRSESLSEKTTSPSETKIMRNSRSLDCKKLRRDSSISSSVSSEIHRSTSRRSSCRSDFPAVKVSRPRWCIFMFGLVKVPLEMDLRDIKNRQVRRNTSKLFSSSDAGKNVRVGRKSSWGILRVLSCKSNASVAVTTSFGCMPPA